jgi:hypothetical protein
MTVDPRTRAYLDLAVEHRELARRLLTLDDPPLRWVPIIAFESAVHFIQAAVWERYRVRITSHPQRQREIDSNQSLLAIAENYRRLYDISQRLHQHPAYRVERIDFSELLDVDLASIERQVDSILEKR